MTRVIGLRVDAERLARSRFALSRVAEAMNGLEVLVHPDRAPHAHRWVAGVARRLDRARIDILLTIVEHADRYVPDFLVPVPAGYEPSLDEELAAVAATPAERVRDEVRLAFDARPVPQAVAEVLDRGGEEALTRRLAVELHAFWQAEMGGLWPSVRAVLDDDVRRHAVEAGRQGFHRLLDGIHPSLAWDGSSVTVRLPHQITREVPHGLVLLPSAFLPRPAVWLGQADVAMIGYPAWGRGQVWTSTSAGGGEVFGERWATLLADLDVPRTTHELATRHHLAPSTVSYHLSRLHRAGLVVRQRAGQRVLYARTKRATDTMAALATSRS